MGLNNCNTACHDESRILEIVFLGPIFTESSPADSSEFRFSPTFPQTFTAGSHSSPLSSNHWSKGTITDRDGGINNLSNA